MVDGDCLGHVMRDAGFSIGRARDIILGEDFGFGGMVLVLGQGVRDGAERGARSRGRGCGCRGGRLRTRRGRSLTALRSRR